MNYISCLTHIKSMMDIDVKFSSSSHTSCSTIRIIDETTRGVNKIVRRRLSRRFFRDDGHYGCVSNNSHCHGLASRT